MSQAYTQAGLFTATVNGQAFTVKKATYTVNNTKQEWVENYSGDSPLKVTPQVVKCSITILYNTLVDLLDYVGMTNCTVVLALPSHTLVYNSAWVVDVSEGDAADENSVTIEFNSTNVQEM